MVNIFQSISFKDQFDEDLYFEILKSQLKRTKVQVIFFAVLTVVTAFVHFILPNHMNHVQRLSDQKFPMLSLLIFAFVAFLFEFLIHKVLSMRIKKRFRMSELLRFSITFVETSFPTILLVMMMQSFDPKVALNTSVPFLYSIFIILSTLGQDSKLSIFAGLVAGLEFALVGYYFLSQSTEVETFFNSPSPIFVKSFFLIISGFIAGYVSKEIRIGLESSLHAMTEKNKVINMFGQYMSPEVAEKLIHQNANYVGEIRHVTVMFFDIRDFTKFSEKKNPEEVMAYLNLIYEYLINIVNKNNGIINKFLGDGFMAVFGAPFSDGQDTQNAVRAAVEISEKVDELNLKNMIPPTKIGIGLHSGEALSGCIGSEKRKEYTIIGDTVNVASRVEQLNKQYSSVLLITEDVYQIVKNNYPGKALEAVEIKGRETPVQIYQIL